MMKVLIVESEFLHQDTWVGNAVERLADALSQQNVTVIKSTSFDDGFAILSSNEAIDCLMFSYQMEHPDEHQNVRQLIGKLHERQQNVPVFLLGDREKALAAMDRDLLELVDEFAWILEDTADFIAGRAVAAMTRYRQQLLPPLFSALMKYSDIHKIEYKIKTSSANDVTYTDRFLYFYDKKDKLLDKVNFSNAEGADFNTIQKQIKERAPHIEWIYPS